MLLKLREYRKNLEQRQKAGNLMFPSTTSMYLIDSGLIAASVSATVVVLRQWRRLKYMKAIASALMLLAGVWLILSIFIADLFAMALLPRLAGAEVAYQFMIKIHTHYFWYASGFGLVQIISSLILFTRRFVLHEEKLRLTTEDLRTAEVRLKVAISGARIGVFDLNLETGKSAVNPSWMELMGFGHDEKIDAQREWLKRVHPEDLSIVQQADAECLAGISPLSETEYRLQTAQGNWRWMKSLATAYRSSNGRSGQRLIGVMSDITELKESELIRREFISTVSHELRTPVSSIHGSLRLILSSGRADLSRETYKLLEIAQRNSDRLVRLINDILDVEKLTNQSGIQYQFRELAVGRLVQQAVSSVRPLCSADSIHIEIDDRSNGSKSLLDKGRYEQVLVNLLSNAIKFSPPSGVIKVTVQSDGATNSVSVTDHGPGISAEFTHRAFERFRTDDRKESGSKQGAGLGLHISRRIVEEMGGKISFESEPHVATTFWVCFPTRPVTDLAGVEAQDLDHTRPTARSESSDLAHGQCAVQGN